MKELTAEEKASIIAVLKERFEKNNKRFAKLKWNNIENKLKENSDKLWALHEMERTCGEPSLMEYRKSTDEYIFCDFSKESPKDRRSLCYDKQALEARKKFKPVNTVIDVASEMGISLRIPEITKLR